MAKPKTNDAVPSRKRKKKAAVAQPTKVPQYDYETELADVDKLRAHPKNYKTHPEEQLVHIGKSLNAFGYYKNIVVAKDGTILAGHGVWEAAKKNGQKKIPVRRLAIGPNTTAALKIIAADNELGRLAQTDDRQLAEILRVVADDGSGLIGTGYDEKSLAELLLRSRPLNETDTAPPSPVATLRERFGIPPFSVLDARQGYWQDRKRAWIALGIRSEVGRGNALAFTTGANGASALIDKRTGARAMEKEARLLFSASADTDFYIKKRAMEKKTGRKMTTAEYAQIHVSEGAINHGSSIFDPVICELAYRWFCTPGGTVLDPFAGGSVRGIVAAELGRTYVGVELREEQVKSNREQLAILKKEARTRISWRVGDSTELEKIVDDSLFADLVFTCPPYGDLETYSDDPRDLSTKTHEDFLTSYRKVIAKSCEHLKNDRFAVVVVGDFRDKKGTYRNFIGDTVAAFQDAGLAFYNDAVLVTAIGSGSMRAGNYFETSRKLAKTHQNVLVFLKGDAKRATAAIGKVEFGEIGEGLGEVLKLDDAPATAS